ncbi:Crp/Fnr family transcriptional regulator [Streptomyces sp. NPDC060205]|uniref:Crp/Fnr family transcriptional regulator n=1 Tax=Streptomyces sp. NPDC060205 TaxID=3347072 RepID=UPI00365ECA52
MAWQDRTEYTDPRTDGRRGTSRLLGKPPLPRRYHEDGLQPMVLGNSVYAFDEETGLVEHDLSGARAIQALIDLNPFLSQLSPRYRHEFMALLATRSSARDTQLRGAGASTLHIVLSGCVYEESAYGEDTTVRIHGGGAVLGAAEVFNEDLHAPTAKCLNRTLSLALPIARMRALMEQNSQLASALGRALTDQLVAGERVYNRRNLLPEERLAGLFVHLLDRCAVPCSRHGRMIEGLSQDNLAAALCVSRGTIENAVKVLRDLDLITTGYRQYRFPEERELARFGKVRTLPRTVTGSAEM